MKKEEKEREELGWGLHFWKGAMKKKKKKRKKGFCTLGSSLTGRDGRKSRMWGALWSLREEHSNKCTEGKVEETMPRGVRLTSTLLAEMLVHLLTQVDGV